MKYALLVACCGCSRVFGLEDPSRLTGDAGPTVDALVRCMGDDFSDTTIDPLLWNTYDGADGVIASEGAGTLHIAVPSSGTEDSLEGTVVTKSTFDFARARMRVKLAFAPPPSEAEQDLYILFGNGDQGSLGVSVEGDVLTARTPTDSFSWQPQMPLHVEVAYDAIARVASFSTSTDGAQWSPVGSLPHDQTPTTGTVYLNARTRALNVPAWDAQYDDFSIVSTDCEP